MATVSRLLDRGRLIGDRALLSIGDEFATARRGLGVSQANVAGAARVDRSRYSRIERGRAHTLQVVEVAKISAVLGLDPSFRLYPGGHGLRDAGHARRIREFLRHAALPLRTRTEVSLPSLPDRRDLRAWDAMIIGAGGRTAVELEMRLHDLQALERRLGLKRRDDPTEHFLLLVADSRTNRQVLRGVDWRLSDLVRLGTGNVQASLEAGRHPGTGIVLI